FINAVDHVIALCNWTRELLIRNGVAPEKITLSRHGIGNFAAEPAARRAPAQGPIRLAFLGRLDPTKGAHVVVRALKGNPGLDVGLALQGVRRGDAGDRYLKQLEAMTAGDPRIRLLPPLHPDEVIPCLRKYHALVVPSQCLETGPLVVLEAFASGIPVIG